MKQLLLILVLSLAAAAQTGYTTTVPFAGVPSGSCKSSQLALNTSSGVFYNCSGGAWSSISSGFGGAGTVTTFSAGTGVPFFTTSVANAGTTPALTFNITSQTANTVLAGPTGGAAAAPTFRVLTLASADFVNQGSTTTLLHGNAAGNPSFAGVALADFVANLGTTTTVLHGNAAGQPTYGSVVSGDMNITTTACVNQVVSAISAGGVGTCHTVVSGDTSGTFTATAHNLLSAIHGDTTAAAAVRGDGIFAIGATPTWQRLAHSAATGGYFKWNGTDMVASTGAAGGTGACGANNFETTDNADAAPTCVQPAFSNLSGSATAAQMPAFTGGDCTTSAGAVSITCTQINGANFTVNSSGLPTKVDGITTAGQGVAIVQCITSAKVETGADASVLSCTPASAVGNYEVCISLDVSAASAATLGWTMTWTNSKTTAVAPTNMALQQMGVAAPALTFAAAASNSYYACVPIEVSAAGTAIVVKTTFSGTSIAYNASATVRRII